MLGPITIHTPIESPYRVYSKHAVLRIIYFKIGSKNDRKCLKAQKLVNFEWQWKPLGSLLLTFDTFK
jgi:hypothetical protein